jgi:hypothetical protein
VSDAPEDPEGPGASERPEAQDPADQELIPRTPGEPAWMRLIGPIRSANAAFRAVLWAGGAALAIAAVVVLVRAVG